MGDEQVNLFICAEQVAKAAAALISDRQSELMKWAEFGGKVATPIGLLFRWRLGAVDLLPGEATGSCAVDA